MPHITVLDQNTINKIAAGEVIERPASVVKELMENAIDAKATAVTVEIRDGGISFIRVTDNGCGIPKDEIALAFLRHSTSKIQSVEDLFTVSSLGFRGEALSSIAAVSQVEIITKTSDSLTGTRYQIEGGEEKSLEEVGAPDGTTFISRNLFYNTPVRRKFLKTAQTEGAHVADLVEKIALSHPEVSIRLIQNNQNKLHTSGNHNLKDIIYTIFGREIAVNLLPIEASFDTVSVRGFIGKPVIARSNRNYENYYINGRYIKSGIIAKAIEEAYKPYMMQHKYPFTLLHFSIEPEFLDVNVHPTKMELRFRDGERIYQMIVSAIQNALAHKELIPEVNLAEKEKKMADELRRQAAKAYKEMAPEPFEKKRMEALHIAPADVTPAAPAEPVQSLRRPADHRLADSRLADKIAADKIAADKVAAGAAEKAGVKEKAGEISRAGKIGEERADYRTGASSYSGRDSGRNLAPRTSSFDELFAKPGGNAAEKRAGEIKDEEIKAERERQETEAAAQQDKPEEPKQLDLFDGKLLEPESRKRHQLIGQLFNTYWLVEFDGHLYIIDQHAAHEKVLYEQTMESLKKRDYTSQAVNPPIILTLNTNEELLLNSHMEYFQGIGFEIEHFGGREYAVRGVPGNLFSIAKKELLMEMIDGLSDDTRASNPDMIYEKIASMSCKAAVKGNHAMSAAEANALIDKLLTLDNPYACPHGRPTIISMSKYELEKKFKRIV